MFGRIGTVELLVIASIALVLLRDKRAEFEAMARAAWELRSKRQSDCSVWANRPLAVFVVTSAVAFLALWSILVLALN